MNQQTNLIREPDRMPTGKVEASEGSALRVVIVALMGFGIYGCMTGAASTAGYLITVSAVAAIIWLFRGIAVPRPLALALAALAVLHLAGGLVRVGDDVLYNASLGAHAFRYDHFVHAYGSFVGTLALWTLLGPGAADHLDRHVLIAVWVLAGLGLGAINETVEFLSTVAHQGAHVGGYTNTGWDLVSNVVGALAAGLVIARTRHAGDRLTALHPA